MQFSSATNTPASDTTQSHSGNLSTISNSCRFFGPKRMVQASQGPPPGAMTSSTIILGCSSSSLRRTWETSSAGLRCRRPFAIAGDSRSTVLTSIPTSRATNYGAACCLSFKIAIFYPHTSYASVFERLTLVPISANLRTINSEMEQMVDLAKAKHVPVADLLTTRDAAVAQVAAGHPAPGPLRWLWPEQDGQPTGESEAEPLPPIELFALADVELHSNRTPYRGGVPVTSERVYPKYVKRYFDGGFVQGFADVQGVREAGVPAFCISHFNMTTYGHFLMEVLPKVLLARSL